MTPRPDQDVAGPHRGLSAHVDPRRAIPPLRPGERRRRRRVYEIDVGALEELYAFLDEETGHVSLRPATDAELREWAESRGREGPPHRLTLEVQSAIIAQMDIEL